MSKSVNMSSDLSLAELLDEPPRKRRAAAVAAQKNWQMLSVPEDEVGADDGDEDFIEVTQVIRSAPNVAKVAQTSNITTPLGKRSIPHNIVIDLNRSKRTVEVDKTYNPHHMSGITHNVKARKSFPTPPLIIKPKIQTIAQNVVRVVPRVKGPETILIETDTTKRVILRTDGSNYRKPLVNKLVAGEPIDTPIVEGEEEVIVGTYDDDLLNKNIECDDVVEELSLILFCESENKSSDVRKNANNESNDDIQIIEDTNSQKIANKVPLKTVQNNYHVLRHLEKDKMSRLEPIIDTLEMECENFDDEFTDGLRIDCEEDILNESQWKQSAVNKKEFLEYSKSVVSTKNVKFLPEAQVTEPVGISTTTVSETTKIVTIPMTTKVRTRPIHQPIMVQSVRAPIPSLVNQSILQRGQRMVCPQISTQNQMPFTIFPASSSGTTNPLILSPSTFIGPNVSSNMGLILQSGPVRNSSQPTYVMLPRSSIANGISQNIIISNASAVPTLNRSFQFSNQSQIRSNMATILRPTGPRLVPPSVTQFVRPFRPIGQTIRPMNTYNQTIRVQTYSNVNQTNVNRSVTANSLFDCLTVFKGTQNATKKIDMKNVLTIKPLPFSWPSNIDALINSLIKLDNALMKEKFKESPIAWMVSANLILPPTCKACSIGICNQVNKTVNSKNGAEYWHCNNPSCKRSFLIDRPKVFADPKYDIAVSKLLFLIYYWSIQVDVEDLIKTGQIEMGTEKIFSVWNRLQKVCSQSMQLKDAKLGPVVEICSIQVGRFHLLGAMERNTHRTRVAVVPVYEIVQKNGKQALMLPFVKWLSPGCHVVTCESKFSSLNQYGFRVTLQSKNEFLAQNKNLSLTTISGYLIHHLQRFFKDMDLSTLSSDMLSNIFEELLWRERYGNNPFTAFYNIIKHISEQCGLRKPHCPATIVQTNIPAIPAGTGIRTPPVVKRKSVQQTNKKQTTTRPVEQEPKDPSIVFVDEYFYSSLTLKTSAAKIISQEEMTKNIIQCHLCQMIYNNILIVNHLIEHFEKERRGRVRKGDNNEPECKHCLRFYSNRALHLHEEMANSKVIVCPFSCRICLLPLLARQPFIGHMKTTHFSGEMPYYCDICSFRSSFQKSLSEHFEESHTTSNQVMCPYCIRIFDVTKFKNFSSFLYRHLTTHYAVASVYDCDKCVLTFVSKQDLKEHCFKGHNPSNAIDEKFVITNYKVEKNEESLCTRAKEMELFTPFLPNFENNPEFNQNSAIPEVTSSGETDTVSFEISCEPNIADFLSIEPDIEFDMNDGNTYLPDNNPLPVDCDYSNDQLKNILTNSFVVNQSNDSSNEAIEGVEPNPDPNTEPIPEPNPEPSPVSQKDYILSNNQRVICFECESEITTEHYTSRMFCEKCNFTSHCKTSFEGHITNAHVVQPSHQTKQNTVLKPFEELISYKNICKECGFVTTDGNKIALHMIQLNHLNIMCKPLDFVTKSDQTLNSETISDKTLNSETISDKTLNSETISDKTLDSEINSDKTLNSETIFDKTLNSETIFDKTLNSETNPELL